WVKMGAPWPADKVVQKEGDAWRKHWAFQPIRQPDLPAVKNPDWLKTPIDRFILAGLEQRGLTPSAAADRRTLLRRATFDLIGLPPTPEEIAAFAADTSPDAFARVVDRLLASPHYGERWGRYWLDVARYADNKGYVFLEDSSYPWAYTYRDYVIRAFNEDLPYNRFVLEQLAADQLDLGKDKRALTALGYLTVGGRFMNNGHDIIDDRIDVVCRGLMGLTMTCARCHDHKYDPIPTADYYSLYGVFASSPEPVVPPLFEPVPDTEEYRKYEAELNKRVAAIKDFVSIKQAEVTEGAKTRLAEYLLKAHAVRNQPRTDDFMLLADAKDLNPKMLERWRAYLERGRRKHDPVFALWHAYTKLPEAEFAARAAETTERVLAAKEPALRINQLVALSFAGQPPASLKEAALRYSELLNSIERRWIDEKAGRPRTQRFFNADEEELRLVFQGPEAVPNVPAAELGDLSLLPDRPSQDKLKKLRKDIEEWRATGAGAPPRAMAVEDAPYPFEPYVFLRGNPNNHGPRVPRQLPMVLAGENRTPFLKGSGRLELARAIVDPANPLTARVMVNRIWLHHFGAGLVSTPSDFGLRSDPPSHPELLDHLAVAFREKGWSIKQMHRLIMLSATYQQSSSPRAAGQRVDPENTLLWRMNRVRLDFEATRDALLAASGQLDRNLGGPAVKNILTGSSPRRTIYGFIDRLNLPELFRSFDYPNPDATSPERTATTVPQQALFFMNHPFVLETSRKLLGRQEVAAASDQPKKVIQLYRIVYGRLPDKHELELARQFLGDKPADIDWERYAQALLLSNEFVFVD
ncbi:MAG: DUF1549 and DUF1553 domain-containing protein, partial [Gemmataceae bacterium]